MKNLHKKDYAFVSVQLLLFIGYVLPIDLCSISIPLIIKYLSGFIGLLGILILLVSLINLNRNLTPFPSPKSDANLITTGLYHYARHPIYTGILFMFFGCGLYQQNCWRILISFLLLFLFYLKTNYEEILLSNKYPNYQQYKLKTGRFLPFF